MRKEDLKGTYTREDFVLFWGHKPSADGTISDSCLSQWWKAPFTEDGVTFTCAEQYMMYHKALTFNDSENATNILNCCTPKRMKQYGREVKDFTEQEWAKVKFDIVVNGNRLKFSQNKDLCDYLLNTGDKILVEASPFDKVWGIGMRKTSANAVVPSNWNGSNLLGFALMTVRDELKSR